MPFLLYSVKSEGRVGSGYKLGWRLRLDVTTWTAPSFPSGDETTKKEEDEDEEEEEDLGCLLVLHLGYCKQSLHLQRNPHPPSARPTTETSPHLERHRHLSTLATEKKRRPRLRPPARKTKRTKNENQKHRTRNEKTNPPTRTGSELNEKEDTYTYHTFLATSVVGRRVLGSPG